MSVPAPRDESAWNPLSALKSATVGRRSDPADANLRSCAPRYRRLAESSRFLRASSYSAAMHWDRQREVKKRWVRRRSVGNGPVSLAHALRPSDRRSCRLPRPFDLQPSVPPGVRFQPECSPRKGIGRVSRVTKQTFGNLPVYVEVAEVRDAMFALSRISNSNSEAMSRYSSAIAAAPGTLDFDQ